MGARWERGAGGPLIGVKNQLRRVRRTIRAMAGKDVRTGPKVSRRFIRLGNWYGGWDVVPELLGPTSVVYSFGVGDDVSWDLGMVERFGLEVHAFDPTPRSMRWIEKQTLPSKFHFHPWGIADFDGNATFVMRSSDPTWNSYNLSADTSGAQETVNATVKRLGTIMKELGHARLDVLKMDVEGAEYGVLKDLLASPVRPTQLLVEFHYFGEGRAGIERTEKAMNDLRLAGYGLFSRSPAGAEYSFVLADSKK